MASHSSTVHMLVNRKTGLSRIWKAGVACTARRAFHQQKRSRMMKRMNTIGNKALVMFMTLLFSVIAGSGTGTAGEYHCQSDENKCSVTISTYSASIYCMQKNETGQCTFSPYAGNIECTFQSQTRTFPRSYLNRPINFCSALCGTCSSGWTEYQGGGSTF